MSKLADFNVVPSESSASTNTAPAQMALICHETTLEVVVPTVVEQWPLQFLVDTTKSFSNENPVSVNCDCLEYISLSTLMEVTTGEPGAITSNDLVNKISPVDVWTLRLIAPRPTESTTQLQVILLLDSISPTSVDVHPCAEMITLPSSAPSESLNSVA